MLSQSTFAQIAQVTEQVLQQISTFEVIDRVTIIRGYAQLLVINPRYKGYEEKLVMALLDLSHVVSRFNRAELTRNLQALVAVINAERAS